MKKENKMSSIIMLGVSLVLGFASLNCPQPPKSTVVTPTKFCDQTTTDGHITSNMTIAANSTCTFTGINTVDAGATLTIGAGTTLIADASASPTTALIISPGAKIVAIGTAGSPIVFTSSKNAGSRGPGDWGGLVLRGYATVHNSSYTSELPDKGTSGGTVDTDNSGSLQYVRVEFGGKQMDSTHEYNGITFEAVGNGTFVDNIHVNNNADDGIEFFGGAANISHVISTKNHDDMLDWTYGYHGNIQFAVLGLFGGATDSTLVDSNFIEADNSDQNYNTVPNSKPLIANVTAVSDYTGIYKKMFRFRRGTGAKLIDVYVGNSCMVPSVESDQSISILNGYATPAVTGVNANLAVGDLSINNSVFEKIAKLTAADYNLDGIVDTQFTITCTGNSAAVAAADVSTGYKSVATAGAANESAAATYTSTSGAALIGFVGNANAVVGTLTDAALVVDPNVTTHGFKPAAALGGTPADPFTVFGGFFVTANYIGAVDPAGVDWTAWAVYTAN